MGEPTSIKVPLAYATDAPRPASRVGAAVALVGAGIALVLLGGCFLIGILILVKAPVGGLPGTVPPLTPSQVGLMVALYALASVCLIGALVLFVAGARSLIRIARA